MCFAAGFSETATEEGARLTQELVRAAGELPFFGPNCYGFINFFDGAALWPDQLVGRRRERGVVLICQSGTIALNLLFNDRSLPLGAVLTVGNQTRLAAEDLIELFAWLTSASPPSGCTWKAFRMSRALPPPPPGRAPPANRSRWSKPDAPRPRLRPCAPTPVRSPGADGAFDAFCAQAGIARCESPATLCETLKIFHAGGPLRGRKLSLWSLRR